MEGLFDSVEDSNDRESGGMNQEFQKRLFVRVRDYRSNKVLAGYIQNDFKRKLDEGEMTMDGLRELISKMEADYDKYVADLLNFKEQCKTIMEYYLV